MCLFHLAFVNHELFHIEFRIGVKNVIKEVVVKIPSLLKVIHTVCVIC